MSDEEIRSPGLPADESKTEEAHESVRALIDRWFADHFHGSIVSRDTDVYAHVFEAKEKLKKLLVDRKE